MMIEFICGALIGSVISIAVLGAYFEQTCRNLRMENAGMKIDLLHKRQPTEGRVMKESEFRERLSRITAMLAISDARLMSNPKPYLEDMGRRCFEVLKVLEDVKYALSPDMVFDVWDSNCNKSDIPRPADIQGEALIRCNAALRVLSDNECL